MKFGDGEEVVVLLATEFSLNVYAANVLRCPIRLRGLTDHRLN